MLLYIAIIVIIAVAALYENISENRNRKKKSLSYSANRAYNTEIQNQINPITFEYLTEELVVESDGTKKTKLILDSIENGNDIRFKYTDLNKRQSIRTVTPKSLYRYNSNYYVRGLCYNDNLIKTFRLSRMAYIEKQVIDNRTNTSLGEVESNHNGLEAKKDNQRMHLNPESELKRVGYNTSLNKDERQSILINVAVPQLGVKKVKAHLEFLIRLNINKTDYKMDRAIKIWQEDLGILENNK